jgi:retron-type reverse transcriptase
VKCFDKIQHEILITILKKKLHDQELIDLLRKFLNVGYIDVHNLTNRGRYETEKITQMTIISPIMCNILFHQLDEFMEDKLIPKFTNNRFSEENKKNSWNYTISSHNQDNLQIHELSQLKKIIPLLKRNEEILKKNSFYYKKDDLYQEQQLFYLRYADAILLGYLGTKNECKKVIVEINKYLQKNLKLELNLSLCFVNSV